MVIPELPQLKHVPEDISGKSLVLHGSLERQMKSVSFQLESPPIPLENFMGIPFIRVAFQSLLYLEPLWRGKFGITFWWSKIWSTHNLCCVVHIKSLPVIVLKLPYVIQLWMKNIVQFAMAVRQKSHMHVFPLGKIQYNSFLCFLDL